MRKQRLADTSLSDDQRMQPIRRIKDSRLRLLNLTLETLIRTNQPAKRIHFLLTATKLPALIDVPELTRSIDQIQIQHGFQ